MGASIAIPQALLVSFFFLSFLFGIYTLLLAATIYLLLRRRKEAGIPPNRISLSLMVVMYLISIAHFSMTFHQDVIAFFVPPGATQILRNLASLGIVQLGLAFTNCVLADSVLLWRAWVIYQGDYRVVTFPAIMVLASCATSFKYLDHLSKAQKSVSTNNSQAILAAPIGFNPGGDDWGLAAMVVSLCTNIFLTTIIAGRFWHHNRMMKTTTGRSSSLSYIALVIVESGAIYSFAWVILLALMARRSNATLILMDIITQFSGIIPTMIVVVLVMGLGGMAGQSPGGGSSLSTPHRLVFATTSGVNTSENIHDINVQSRASSLLHADVEPGQGIPPQHRDNGIKAKPEEQVLCP